MTKEIKKWMPMFWPEYLADTGHLCAAEHGAYLLLIAHYWMKGELPKDERIIKRITKLTDRQWALYRDNLSSLFDDDWSHKRVDQELAYAIEKSKRLSANAKLRHSIGRAEADTPTPTPTKKDIVDLKPAIEAKKEEIEKGFFDFYSAYPKKVARKEAERAYAKARREVSHDAIMAGLHRAKHHDHRFREMKFTPMPSAWLNKGCWADEAPTPTNRDLGILA